MFTTKTKLKEVEAKLSASESKNVELLSQIEELTKQLEANKPEVDMVAYKATMENNAKLTVDVENLTKQVSELEASKHSVEIVASDKAAVIVASQGVPAINNVGSTELDPLSKLSSLDQQERFSFYLKNETAIKKAMLSAIENNNKNNK